MTQVNINIMRWILGEYKMEKKRIQIILQFIEKMVRFLIQKKQKKASVQWDNLPIVVIDVDKCLEAEKEKVQTLEEQYAQTGDIKYLQSLRQKIRNNRITDKNFESQYDLDEIDEEIKKENNHKIKLEDLSEIDKQISAEDREKTIKEFKMQYEKLQKDLKLETHGEGER